MNTKYKELPPLRDITKIIHSAGVLAADSSHFAVATAAYEAALIACAATSSISPPAASESDDAIEAIARAHGSGGWQSLPDMVRFGKAVLAANKPAALAAQGDAVPVARTYCHTCEMDVSKRCDDKQCSIPSPTPAPVTGEKVASIEDDGVSEESVQRVLKYAMGRMSEVDSTDQIRKLFESAFLGANGHHTKAELANEWAYPALSGIMFRAGVEAAKVAASKPAEIKNSFAWNRAIQELHCKPAESGEADEYQQFIDSLDGEDKMFEQIEKWAHESYRRHRSSVRGQQVTAADNENSHYIWAALRWAKETQPAHQQGAAGLTDEQIEEVIESMGWSLDPQEDADVKQFARAIIAALREQSELSKNHQGKGGLHETC